MDTSHNLLRHAKSDFESEAWDRLVYIYEPLIVRWLTRFGISVRDIPDITQEVFLAAAHDLVRFEHNGRPGAFRNWLKTIALNRCPSGANSPRCHSRCAMVAGRRHPRHHGANTDATGRGRWP